MFALCLLQPTGKEVYRCGSSYSDAPCAGGKAVSTEPLVEKCIPRQRSPAAQTPKPAQPHPSSSATKKVHGISMERELDKAQAVSLPQRSATNRRQCEAEATAHSENR